jgi:hypothetical protein
MQTFSGPFLVNISESSSSFSNISVLCYESTNDGDDVDFEEGEDEYSYDYSYQYQQQEDTTFEEILLPLLVSSQNYEFPVSSSDSQTHNERSWNNSVLDFTYSLSIQQKCLELIALLSSQRMMLRFPLLSSSISTSEGLTGKTYEKVICLNNKNDKGKRRRNLFLQLVSLILQLKRRNFICYSFSSVFIVPPIISHFLHWLCYCRLPLPLFSFSVFLFSLILPLIVRNVNRESYDVVT